MNSALFTGRTLFKLGSNQPSEQMSLLEGNQDLHSPVAVPLILPWQGTPLWAYLRPTLLFMLFQFLKKTPMEKNRGEKNACSLKPLRKWI